MLVNSATSYIRPVLKTLFKALKRAGFYSKNSTFKVSISRLRIIYFLDEKSNVKTDESTVPSLYIFIG